MKLILTTDKGESIKVWDDIDDFDEYPWRFENKVALNNQIVSKILQSRQEARKGMKLILMTNKGTILKVWSDLDISNEDIQFHFRPAIGNEVFDRIIQGRRVAINEGEIMSPTWREVGL